MARFAGWLPLAFLLLVAACTSVRVAEEPAVSAEAVQRLEQRVAQRPDDAAALRDLGILYLRADRFDAARARLRQAYERSPDDPETRFFYGLALEAGGAVEEALHLYGTYAELPRLAPYRRRMAGRYRWLLDQVVREELRARIADEALYQQTSPQTIAVFPFRYRGAEAQYAPLGYGLSAMLTTDLSKVERLQVIERVRVQALLDELELAQSEVTDSSTAPRAGRLLSAGRLVGGGFEVRRGDALHLDVVAWEVGEAPARAHSTASDALANLFALEKDLLFRLLDDLGVEPTPQEREAIERVPTRNLQAFLAYSRGLQEADAGRFDAAGAFFEQAQALDPAFSEAADQAETAQGAAEAGGPPEDALASVVGPALAPSAADLVQLRQQNLGSSVGSLYVPGQDAREPAAEATNAAGSTTNNVLPRPRDPPERGGN